MTDETTPERFQPLFEDLFRVCGSGSDVERSEAEQEFAESVAMMRLEFDDLGLSEAAVDAMVEESYRNVLQHVVGLGSARNH